MKIDIHTHTFPAHQAAEIIADLQEKARRDCPVIPQGDGTIADLVRQEREDGFDRFAICPIAVRPEQYHYMVKFLSALKSGACGEEAQQRVIPCASLHPSDPDFREHLKTLIELGAKMIKLHPFFQGVPLSDKRMHRLLGACAEANMPVLCHTGCDISFGRKEMASPYMVFKLIHDIPDLHFICAHCAAWRTSDAERLLLGRNVYVDLSYQPNGGVESVIQRFAREHPQDRVLFGSDWPWSRPGEQAAKIASWGLPPERLEAIMGGNAQRLLNL
ncbi:MAG: amidohydrolase family protein [Kiritimatiellia bacterium]